MSTDNSSPNAGRVRRRSSRTAGPPAGATAVPVVHPEPNVPAAAATEIPALETVSSEPQHSPDSTSAPRGWGFRILAAVAAVLVLGLIVGVVLLSIAKHSAQERDSRRAEFVQAARQSVVNMTTIHQATAKQDVERILANASGDFKAEFGGRADPFVSIVTEAKVDTDGSILESGLESESGDSANVLVAARSTVTNAGDNKPSPRDFRLRVTITDTDGKLTTSKVEFVP